MPYDSAEWQDDGMDARELAALIEARRRLRWSWRWVKFPRPFGVMFGRQCVMQAVLAAEPDMEIRVRLFRRLNRLIPAGFASTPVCNDDPATTHGDILTLLDAAIAELA